jgi:hypothetical protein
MEKRRREEKKPRRSGNSDYFASPLGSPAAAADFGAHRPLQCEVSPEAALQHFGLAEGGLALEILVQTPL